MIDPSATRTARFGQVAALVAFLSVLLMPAPDELPLPAQRAAAVAVGMGVLWLTQAVPLGATSLIPLVAFPLLGVQSAKDVSGSYINESVFLYFGGFIVDFNAGDLEYYLSDPKRVAAVATVSAGTVAGTILAPNVAAKGFRVIVDVTLRPGESTDLRVFLRSGKQALSETWTTSWATSTPAPAAPPAGASKPGAPRSD